MLKSLKSNPKLAEKLRASLEASRHNSAALYTPYQKQKDFHFAKTRVRSMLAGNRVGKTIAACTETSYHLTGRYPDWWEGKRHDKAIIAWSASDTSESTRNILQVTLLGSLFKEEFGTGTIPADCVGVSSANRGKADAVDTIRIKHVSGDWSVLSFKSYDQGRKKFQGTKPDLIHLDEEPDIDIYTECLTRTMTNNGSIMLTMTPLSGMTDVCETLLDVDSKGAASRTVITIGWNDAPHLTPEVIEEMEAQFPPHEIEARKNGTPTVGRGKIYPFNDDIYIAPIEIAKHWLKAYGMDFGWNNTACAFGAYDADTDIWYIYGEYKEGGKDVAEHVVNINRVVRGFDGVCDPAGGSSSQIDGKNLLDLFTKEGLSLMKADNSVNAGINEVYMRLRTGRLKIFNNCQLLRSEVNTYARDKNGKVIKRNDHILDALRYLIATGLEVAKANSSYKSPYAGLMKQTPINWMTI